MSSSPTYKEDNFACTLTVYLTSRDPRLGAGELPNSSYLPFSLSSKLLVVMNVRVLFTRAPLLTGNRFNRSKTLSVIFLETTVTSPRILTTVCGPSESCYTES